MDKVVYGLVFPFQRSDVLSVQVSPEQSWWYRLNIYLEVLKVFLFQFHYYLGLWTKSKNYTSIRDKLLTFVNGPSWRPGKSRLGDHASNPPVSAFERSPAFSIVCVYDLQIVLWISDHRKGSASRPQAAAASKMLRLHPFPAVGCDLPLFIWKQVGAYFSHLESLILRSAEHLWCFYFSPACVRFVVSRTMTAAPGLSEIHYGPIIIGRLFYVI